MELINKIYQRRRRHLCVIYLCSLALTAFFIFHLINGRNGVRNYGYLQQECLLKRQELAEKQQILFNQESLNEAMKSRRLDLDLLEILARYVLGYSKDNELIIER